MDAMGFQLEYEFTLPKGFLDEHGQLYRKGTMRLATAMDEIAPLRDPRVRENEAYHALLILSQVITSMGPYQRVTPAMVETFFAVDVLYLQEFYRYINGIDQLEDLAVTCPNCNHEFEAQVPFLGES